MFGFGGNHILDTRLRARLRGVADCELVTPRLRDYPFRDMSVATSIVLEGVLRHDGTMELRGHPGRVRVTLEVIENYPAPTERLPDPPWPGESVPAPLDLPPPLRVKGVQPREVAERLPDPLQWSENIILFQRQPPPDTVQRLRDLIG
jgi:hypothetical protein